MTRILYSAAVSALALATITSSPERLWAQTNQASTAGPQSIVVGTASHQASSNLGSSAGLICPTGCNNCHTIPQVPPNPAFHHFHENNGSCYECNGDDWNEGCPGHDGPGTEHYKPGSCDDAHEICHTEHEFEAQQVLLALRTGDVQGALLRLGGAKSLVVGAKFLTATFTDCTGERQETVKLPAAILRQRIAVPAEPEPKTGESSVR